MEESNRQILEIIGVARDQAAAAFCSTLQVFLIGEGARVFFMNADRVEPFFSEDFRDRRAEVRVEIVLHWAA